MSSSKEILNNAVYTPEEAQGLLKISRSTFLRLIKKGILRAGKVGGQYRVLGSELLRHVLPEQAFDKVRDEFHKVKDWVKE